MDKPPGIVNDTEQNKLEQCLADIVRDKPFYSYSEKLLLATCWKFKDERNFTVSEAKEILGIHVRIKQKKTEV